MPLIPLDAIYIPERLREETYGDIEELARSMAMDGQLQPILVESLNRVHHPAAPPDIEWVLVDGGRRCRAVALLAESERTVLGHDPLFIDAKTRDSTDDPLTALRLEYFANHYRVDFSWRETAKFYRQVHETLSARFAPKKWPMNGTAQFLGVTERTVGRYLEITEDEELMNSPEVQSADTFNIAHKKVQIAKEKKRRAAKVELRDKREKATGISPADYYSTALNIVANQDCREWIRQLEDNSVDFCHWDPPYGAEQEGGAMTTHEAIDDTSEYAEELMADMIPQISRVLHPGGWLVIWFHQSKREWLKNLLEENGFWVNPYECIWYKVDRISDGHEITRYLTNAYEPFFIAGLPPADTPLVLADSSRQNVFPFPLVRKAARRHIMHKPVELIQEILNVISLRGEFGIDPSCGSASSIEAALKTGRKMIGCELSEGYYLGAVEAVANTLRDLGKPPELVTDPDLPDTLAI